MSTENIAKTRRAMLELAHLAGQSGNEVFVHAEGIAPVQVREVDSMDDDAAFAAIHCWSNDKARVETWLVPLANVRAVQILD